MGSVSADSDPKTEELMAIMDGGENFVKRMTALQNERKALEKARGEVHSSIKFKGTLDDAETHRREAAETLDKVRKDAAKIVQQAQENATALRTQAQKVIADADQHLKDSKAEAEAIKAEAAKVAEAKRAEAQALRDEAAHLQAEAKAKNNELLRQTALAVDECKAAEAARAEFEGKLKALADVLARVK